MLEASGLYPSNSQPVHYLNLICLILRNAESFDM